MMAMLVTLIFVLLKAGLGRGLSLSLTILRSVQMFFLSLLRADFVMNFGFRQFVKRVFIKVDRNGCLPGRTVRVTHFPQSLSTSHLQATRAIPSHSFWIQSPEILSSKLQSLTSLLLRSQNAGHKTAIQSMFLYSNSTLIMFSSEEVDLWEHQDFHLTAFQLRITLQCSGEGEECLVCPKGSYQFQLLFLPRTPSTHTFHTAFKTFLKIFFLNC